MKNQANKIKWYTKHEYVDNQTGEIITPKQVMQEYIIIKKHKNIEYEHSYRKNQRETTGYIKYTNECTRTGKQIKLW